MTSGCWTYFMCLLCWQSWLALIIRAARANWAHSDPTTLWYDSLRLYLATFFAPTTCVWRNNNHFVSVLLLQSCRWQRPVLSSITRSWCLAWLLLATLLLTTSAWSMNCWRWAKSVARTWRTREWRGIRVDRTCMQVQYNVCLSVNTCVIRCVVAMTEERSCPTLSSTSNCSTDSNHSR